MLLTNRECNLCHLLRDLPKEHGYRYTKAASQSLQRTLFTSLVAENGYYLHQLFQHKVPKDGEDWSLRNAQGSVEGSEYSEAARGKACGHIFKSGDATYHCRTCTTDDTCVLCTRCFEGSDHTGHNVTHYVSGGNSGCCDCGDEEAWRVPMKCAIHSLDPSVLAGKQRQIASLPEELVESIRMTVGRAIDYMCDVLSCSPENLRLEKRAEAIKEDERESYLTSRWYEETESLAPEYALILWNDEKHTVFEVRDQVARACRREQSFGYEKANETNDLGRSVVTYSNDISHLLKIAKIIEHIKITVTIRSSRDTFREQMCDTIVEWLEDIAGCSVGDDHSILQRVICEELLKSWRSGSAAVNKWVGKQGLDDHEIDESSMINEALESSARRRGALTRARVTFGNAHVLVGEGNRVNIPVNEIVGDDDDEADSQANDDDTEPERTILDGLTAAVRDPDEEMRGPGDLEDDTEVSEATYAGYPPPPPPPPLPMQQARALGPVRTLSSDSDMGESLAHPSIIPRLPIYDIPKTPWSSRKQTQGCPPQYWLEQPEATNSKVPIPLHEDLRQRVRLDWLMLFDLRLWKRARIGLRDLYIKTVVSVPQFKRILGLRFAGLYTLLAQLFLIADREPDYAVINLSVQMLTTASIVEENVERANFLTNLIAILYTFLTHRQVGHPEDVAIQETLAFDAGSVANRRMYFFFGDLRRLFENAYVQEKLRTERRYQLQFLDLARLPQGVCPNVRAVGDHVEYENDVWIGASLMTKEMNKLCRTFAESFQWHEDEDNADLMQVIRTVAKAAIVNSSGAERLRFVQAEIKGETQFKYMEPFFFEAGLAGEIRHSVVSFVVESEPISFHHALHYTLSWLIDAGKNMSAEKMRSLLSFTVQELQEPPPYETLVPNHNPETYLMAMFDFPLRVCAWLAQMKAGMWVRNGLSLRHQMGTYRNVSNRELGHHRDIFLLQTAMVICDPSRVLAAVVDRFCMEDWMRGHYVLRAGFEPSQQLDVAEDFIHLLIVLLSDRTSLIPAETEREAQVSALRREIAHILCFKPLSFSDLSSRLGIQDKPAEMEVFMETLENMADYKPPEGLTDSGLFELKREHLADVDPYNAHYTKNQRDEAEHAYRSWMAKRTGKLEEEIVLEPKIRAIPSGIFANLSSFINTSLFVQIVFYALALHLHPNMTFETPITRIEAYLHVVLHLVLAAVAADDTDEDSAMEPRSRTPSFIQNVLLGQSELGNTVFEVLVRMLDNSGIKSCHPKIRQILHRIQQRRPHSYTATAFGLASSGKWVPKLNLEALGIDSPRTPLDEDKESKEKLAKELKKKQALDRQAKVMAQFQEQQQNFLNNQDVAEWGDDESDIDSMATGIGEEHRKTWRYPTGNCILCQEETNDTRLFGTFALMTNNKMFRQTNIQDPDYFAEVLSTPRNLDRAADDIRPFGVAGWNRKQISKRTSDGKETFTDHQGLGKGFSPSHTSRDPVSVGCGHMMHYSCFELYCNSTQRRQNHQIARNHPERIDRKEFVCPLCKALGNTFLPIIWKAKEEQFPGALHTEVNYETWLSSGVALTVSRFFKREQGRIGDLHQEQFNEYTSKAVIPSLANKLTSVFQAPLASPISPQGSSTSSIPGRLSLERLLTLSTTPSVPSSATDMILAEELISIYYQIRETIKANSLPSMFPYHPELPDKKVEDLGNTDTLAKILGNSIAATEIAQRGIQSDPGLTFLDKIPTSLMTHLRILSETASSYAAIGGMRDRGANTAASEFLDTTKRQLAQLFVGDPLIGGDNADMLRSKYTPALSQDPFVFLAECSVTLVPAFKLEIHHVVRLCYLLDIVKVSLYMMARPEAFGPKYIAQMLIFGDAADHETLRALSVFLMRIKALSNPPWPRKAGRDVHQSEALEMWQTPQCLLPMLKAISAYALTFLRKSAILLNVRYGVKYPDTGFGSINKGELERLTEVMNLPSLATMVTSVGAPAPGKMAAQDAIITGWIRHWQANQLDEDLATSEHSFESAIYVSLRPQHPGIFELIGLPHQFDTLIYEVTKRRCPVTGNRLEDAALCLFCGDIFCSQASCCTREGKGGCNQHMGT